MGKNKQALEQSFRSLAPFSDQYKVDFKRFLYSLNLLDSFGLIENKNILDVGSGIGIMVGALKNLGSSVIGVDNFIFPEAGQNYYSVPDFEKLSPLWNQYGLRIVKSDIVASLLPFSDNFFDVVICDATIEHLSESPKNLFGEIRRVLKSDGFFLATTPNLTNLSRRLRFCLFGRSPHWDLKDFFDSGSNFKGHRREFTMKEVTQMLEWSSFHVVKKQTKNVFLSFRKVFGRKIAFQLCSFLSLPFPKMREMIYVLAQKSR